MQSRKQDHIEICKRDDVEASKKQSAFADFRFMPCALPELDEADLQLSTQIFGTSFPLPILITGMTGGVEDATRINHNLAALAEKKQIPMGVGSQRVALEQATLREAFQLKRKFPKLFLIGNIGFTQIIKSKDPLGLLEEAADMIDADAMAIHVNTLQECIQQEGDRNFKGFFSALEKVTSKFSRPIYIKEVGAGMDIHSAKRLFSVGIKTIDVGGAGGTSWGYIEGLRSADPITQRLGEIFRDWGLETGVALQLVREHLPVLQLIATGGVRTGIDIAKAMALGANIVGIGLPFLRAALESPAAVEDKFNEFERGLRITMLASGSETLSALKTKLICSTSTSL